MLTAKQMKTYKIISSAIHATGHAPTYRQIADKMGEHHSVSYHRVTSICNRGWLTRSISPWTDIRGRHRPGRRIIRIVSGGPRPYACREFDYFRLDYGSTMRNGWPRLAPAGSA